MADGRTRGGCESGHCVKPLWPRGAHWSISRAPRQDYADWPTRRDAPGEDQLCPLDPPARFDAQSKTHRPSGDQVRLRFFNPPRARILFGLAVQSTTNIASSWFGWRTAAKRAVVREHRSVPPLLQEHTASDSCFRPSRHHARRFERMLLTEAVRGGAQADTPLTRENDHQTSQLIDLGTTWEQLRPNTRENGGAGPTSKQDESTT